MSATRAVDAAEKLTILQVAYPFAAPAPGAVGGAEQVLLALDNALAGAGWRSVVVAPQGAETRGPTLEVPTPRDRIDALARSAAQRAFAAAIEMALERWRVDIVHMHGVDFWCYLPASRRHPILATLHLPIATYPPAVLQQRRSELYFCCVSHTQRRDLPTASDAIFTVPNGIDMRAFRPQQNKQAYVLCLGRICPEKGFHLAIDAAARAGLPIILAGQVFGYAEHERYFRTEIQPRLGPRAQFIGPVGPKCRRRLLARARAVVVPSLIDETSCLVAMEALASGTPVVGFARGALPEIVDHGRTGWLLHDVADLPHALLQAGRLEASACRRFAERHLDMRRMIRGYLRVYRELALGGQA